MNEFIFSIKRTLDRESAEMFGINPPTQKEATIRLEVLRLPATDGFKRWLVKNCSDYSPFIKNYEWSIQVLEHLSEDCKNFLKGRPNGFNMDTGPENEIFVKVLDKTITYLLEYVKMDAGSGIVWTVEMERRKTS